MIGDAVAITELARCLANMIRIGTVSDADYGGPKVRVKAGDLHTGWLPWLTTRAGKDVTWWPPEVGEQVLILCPDGDPAQAVVLMAIYSTAQPAPADRPTIHLTRYPDGAEISYDREAHQLTANIPGDVSLTATGTVTVKADGVIDVESASGITIKAPTVTIEGTLKVKGDLSQAGNLDVTGNVNASGTVMDAGGNSNHHKH
ncbi:phage baseplate assembly protein V [Niveispirillum sp. SYP-B3756]|uniref:phage baseplate assembly protein V n=1 Tax=Niveispirillum sp. SYP-B3756 TaxID=2662178 RepID=UPI001291F8F4|nr:phage baseplate assembly protein V [Niveispirillum sp. SYP-B3756]MQP64715.1 phage baseplate assembly protein V [Niveispirillum sp. SYP-B3756]